MIQVSMYCLFSYRFWPRDPNPENLFQLEVTPVQTDIVVERDPTTGKLKGYKEVRT